MGYAHTWTRTQIIPQKYRAIVSDLRLNLPASEPPGRRVDMRPTNHSPTFGPYLKSHSCLRLARTVTKSVHDDVQSTCQ